jgi:hypothetical protein
MTARWLPQTPGAAPAVVSHSVDSGSDGPPKEPPGSRLSALALEWQALESPSRRPDLFRKAGDRYLEDNGDVESAVRCYRTALDLGTSEDARVSPTDSWLLVSLKVAKQKEMINAINKG